MHLFIFSLGIGLLPTVYTLKCHECELPTGRCTTKECPGGQKCGVLKIDAYAGATKVSNVSIKSCASSELCTEGSVNYGVARTMITTKCCDKDLCNNGPVPDAVTPKPNGKKCFYCEGEACTGTVNCLGNENHCISTKVVAGSVKVVLKGCASKMMCSVMDMPAVSEGLGGDIHCCQGDFCNSASSVIANLLLLLAPLISSALFF